MTTSPVPDGLKITGVRTPGLGDTTYLLTYEGRGLLVDPQRDVDRFLSRFVEADAELRWVLETHLHNDYVSGGVAAAARSGAELVLPAAAAPQYRHTPAFHLEDIGDDRLMIRPVHTPGHTPEHTSYLVLIEGQPVALFSGGSLLVGSAGRPDLLGVARAETLARLQYVSVNRLAKLPSNVGLYPTHGEGSLCAVSGASKTTSTIGEERQTNPVLGYVDIDTFVAGQLSVLQPYPAYYKNMGPLNLEGVGEIATDELSVLDADDLAEIVAHVQVIDIRDRHDFAAGHIPSSLGVELRDDFGTWVGWLVDIETPLVLVADPAQDIAEARIQLARIGYDKISGVLFGIGDWRATGRPVACYDTVDLTEFSAAASRGEPILDVRSPAEFEEGHISASRHVYLPYVKSTDFDLGDNHEIWVACATGYRASIAAALLEQRGLRPRVLSVGGVPDVIRAAVTAPVATEHSGS